MKVYLKKLLNTKRTETRNLKRRFLIIYDIAIVFNAFRNACRDTLVEFLELLSRKVILYRKHNFFKILEIYFLAAQTSFHNAPHIFDYVQVHAVSPEYQLFSLSNNPKLFASYEQDSCPAERFGHLIKNLHSLISRGRYAQYCSYCSNI